MRHLLLVEDNEGIIKGLKYSLEQEEYDVDTALKIEDAKNLLEKNSYSLIILDISLPDGNGFDLCRYIKEKDDIPVIFLTAKDEEKDVVLGFDLGADDYVIKPFRTRELLSRINRVLKQNKENSSILKCGNIKIDLDAARVFKQEEEITMTSLEYKILVMLFSNMNHIVTRDLILDKIWDMSGKYVNDNTLTVYIKRIREKLGKENKDIIKTIKGIGYRVDQC